ncbi:hypothetical protein ABT039_21595 [Streptomyces lasiicapitis]|uniref:hypothetical protein n=1 Tax=Streptomyces lasiicapitis TaxID=1923961 RepID=UPI003330336F
MTVSLSWVLVLGLVAWGAVKVIGARPWTAVLITLLALWISHTFVVPAVASVANVGFANASHA